MATVKKSVFEKGNWPRCLIVSAALVLFVAGSAYSASVLQPYATDEEGRRHFRITQENLEDYFYTLGWPHVYFQDRDVFEFLESDDPYVLTKGITPGNHIDTIFIGVKADGSAADPAKVVFKPADGTSNGFTFSGVALTNRLENMTFYSMPFGLQTAQTAPVVFSNCVFTAITANKQAISHNSYTTKANPLGVVVALDCRFENMSRSSASCVSSVMSFAATNCVFSCLTNNASGFGGSATAFSRVRNLSCSGCVFSDIHGEGRLGGAIYLDWTETFAFDRCIFERCTQTSAYDGVHQGGGGVIFVDSTTAVVGSFRNCLFVDNGCVCLDRAHSAYGGSAIMVDSSSSVISVENCTFANNTLSYLKTNQNRGDGAIFVASAQSFAITNCVFHNNKGLLEDEIAWKKSHLSLVDWTTVANCLEANFEEGGTTYDFSSIDTGAAPTTHIIDGVNGCLVGDYDPKFADAANGDYTILKSSPCRDAGTLLAWMDSSSLDLAGTARVFGDHPDIGCYEWWQKLMGLSIFVR